MDKKKRQSICVGVLTSGGDAPGMNAAVRAVIRTSKNLDAKVFGIKNGYQGLVDGGDNIIEMKWNDVSNIIHDGGTILGSARCKDFSSRNGQIKAARNLLDHGIDRLIVIGGDGSLTGAYDFQNMWSSCLRSLVENENYNQEIVKRHPTLYIAGIVGSIDNDVCGTDLTIGTDTALHRIIEAVDAIYDTAVAHQRTFVVKVMGRYCGYLGLMSALITGADWVLIPENPPDAYKWKEEMCETLKAGIDANRRATIVILSEGVKDTQSHPIDSKDVSEALEQYLKVDVRVTVLGHVQRGGSPSAFDRIQGALLGNAAAEKVISGDLPYNPCLVGMRGYKIKCSELKERINETQSIATAVEAGDYNRAMELRGSFFRGAYRVDSILHRPTPNLRTRQHQKRIAILHSGSPAPGMNTAVRAAVRLGIDKGFMVYGVERGFEGLINRKFKKMDWMSVNGLSSPGGAKLGTTRVIPNDHDLESISNTLNAHRIEGLLIIGGLSAYRGAQELYKHRNLFGNFNIPIVCMPATVSNNIPGTEVSIGSDTALNNIIDAVDKIKQYAGASRRCIFIEVMGRFCGYLAVMSGLATGAEQVYTHEDGIELKDMQADLKFLKKSFRKGRKLALMIRNERANSAYTTPFMETLFEEESENLFNVRYSILGHIQQGGNPSPLDRIVAVRLADECIDFLRHAVINNDTTCKFFGLEDGRPVSHDLKEFPEMIIESYDRPKEQWWLDLKDTARKLARKLKG